mgnify:CR=1 FL=1
MPAVVSEINRTGLVIVETKGHCTILVAAALQVVVFVSAQKARVCGAVSKYW